MKERGGGHRPELAATFSVFLRRPRRTSEVLPPDPLDVELATRSRIIFITSSTGRACSIHRSGLMRATTNARKYGLTSPRLLQLLYGRGHLLV
jgi:hypothetical protein